MVEREDRRFLSSLPVELQVTLGFEKDQSGEWLVHDEFVGVGNPYQHGETVPASIQVASDGSHYRIRTHRNDIEGILALSALNNPQTGTFVDFTAFWNDHPKFRTFLDDDHVYIGMNITPTPAGFEEDVFTVNEAYDLALSAVMEGKSYRDLLENEETREELARIEGVHGRSLLFSSMEQELYGDRPEREPEPPIEADTLADFPIGRSRTSMNFVPGNIRLGSEDRKIESAWVVLQPAHDMVPRRLVIWDPVSRYDREKGEWDKDTLTLEIPIPDEVDIQTMKDLEKLTSVQLKRERVSTEEANFPVSISVVEDTLTGTSYDGNVEVKLEKPTCDNCEQPNWKFPFPDDELAEELEEVRSFFGYNIGAGIMRFQVPVADRTECICANCVRPLVNQYLQDHPFATKKRAINVARRRLDESGNTNIQIIEDQVWRTGESGWEFMTELEYERNGRKIKRYTGTPTLTDDGSFNNNLKSREYINFRYKA